VVFLCTYCRLRYAELDFTHHDHILATPRWLSMAAVDAPRGVTIYSGPTYSGGQIPNVNGIPCTPEHYATFVTHSP
jgi:hypothetical protein